MTFPFAISSKIILDQKDYDITSEMYILSKISDHMDQFGMRKQRISENELFYMKMSLMRTFRRRDFMRNLSIRVDCTDETIQISLKTNTLLIFFVALAAVIFPFFLPDYHIAFHIMAFVIAAVVPYLAPAIALSVTKSELIQVMHAFKKKE